MSIDKYNAEGYFDPVTYEALTKLKRKSERHEKPPPSDLWFISAVLIPVI